MFFSLQKYIAKLTHAQKAALSARVFTGLLCLLFACIFAFNQLVPSYVIKDMFENNQKLSSLDHSKLKNKYEVFGFAPYWTLNKMENVDFGVLTTLAYFGVGVNPDGTLDTTSPGYTKFYSDSATALFQKAHTNGARVVLTVTQMDNSTIVAFLSDPSAQKKAIDNIVSLVAERGIDGVNIDFEYVGDTNPDTKNKFSQFVSNLSNAVHSKLDGSYVTVSVYASSARSEKLYDIAELSRTTDGIFMMAYDFATTGSDNAMPTAPLYGYKEGKYWYDISTAVTDFLSKMPKEKLILGLPWYGYNYPVTTPAIKAQKDYGYYSYYWYRGRRYKTFIGRPGAYAATYATAKNVTPDMQGWDDTAQVGWQAYKGDDGWRMIFLDDARSLSVKYDFAKAKGLGGVGMWALGFDDGNTELWQLLENKFGKKLVASNIVP